MTSPINRRPGPARWPTEDGTTLDDCPECGAPTECLARWTWESTDGPLEHVKIRCVLGHWFAMPAWMLDPASPRNWSVPSRGQEWP